jgi:hypothetical protein
MDARAMRDTGKIRVVCQSRSSPLVRRVVLEPPGSVNGAPLFAAAQRNS